MVRGKILFFWSVVIKEKYPVYKVCKLETSSLLP